MASGDERVELLQLYGRVAEGRAPTVVEGVFNDEVAAASGTIPQADSKHVTENLHRDVEDRLEERRIVDGAQAAVKQLETEELTTLFEELLDDILCTSYHSAQKWNQLGQVYRRRASNAGPTA